jgi:hypothetical protein
MMKREDLQAIAGVGDGLWADSERAHRTVLDAFAAVALLGLDESGTLERVSRNLLDLAERDGPSVNSAAAGRAFFRLLPEERLILTGLHSARWSYARLARILGQSPERVAEIAWGARIHLASLPHQKAGKPFFFSHPAGSSGTSCPEYHPGRPWTQAFFDEELDRPRRHFLETHTAACASCQGALKRARAVWYAADACVPRRAPAAREASVTGLERLAGGALRLVRPADRDFLQALGIFLGRRDVRWLVAALVVLAIAWLRR